MDNNRYCVIMCGGVGSRFWPFSKSARPKQFIDFFGTGRSLLQMTFDRLQGIVPNENIILITNESYGELIKEQLPEIDDNQILMEPVRRNTAPCIAWACWRIKAEDPDANVVVTPADAVVMNPTEFRRVMRNALAFTENHDAIVTIGIKPSRPETGYGYVEIVESSEFRVESGEIRKVREFKEKPDHDTAEKYLAAGNYLWNAGIFVWNVATITDAIRTYKPNIAADMERMKTAADVLNIFPTCEKISIDFAVMEPAAADGKVYTHPADFGWSDLGNWASLYDKLEHDADGNGCVGNVHLYECHDCVVHTEDATKVVLQGLDDYIVSAKGGRILVCRRSEEQRIKEFSAKNE